VRASGRAKSERVPVEVPIPTMVGASLRCEDPEEDETRRDETRRDETRRDETSEFEFVFVFEFGATERSKFESKFDATANSARIIRTRPWATAEAEG